MGGSTYLYYINHHPDDYSTILPVTSLWISKLLDHSIAGVIQGASGNSQADLSHLLMLVSAQAAFYLLGGLLSTGQNTLRSLLGDLMTNQLT